MVDYPPAKIKLFGGDQSTAAEINACAHDWVERKATLLDYIRAGHQCESCGTWKESDDER